jgi:hypothetical protein
VKKVCFLFPGLPIVHCFITCGSVAFARNPFAIKKGDHKPKENIGKAIKTLVDFFIPL